MKKIKRKISVTELNEKIRGFEQLCRKAGLKVTPQRTAVYKELIKTDEHPSAEMLHKKVKKIFPNISLDTVNRTLQTLTDICVAFVVEGSGDARRFDGGEEKHQHFKCIKCKRIIDFHHKPFDNVKVPKAIREKFKVLRKTVYLEGICDSCMQKNKS